MIVKYKAAAFTEFCLLANILLRFSTVVATSLNPPQRPKVHHFIYFSIA